MKHFSTSNGDEIHVECEELNRSFSGDISLVVKRESNEKLVDGVLTSSTHGDEIHELFAREAEFRIVVKPARRNERVIYEDGMLLSSSGKWTAIEEVDPL